MAETANLPEQTQEQSQTVANKGQRKSFTFTSSQDDNVSMVAGEPQVETAPVTTAQVDVNTQEVKETALTKDQLSSYFKSLGIDFDGDTETLKQKFQPKKEEASEEEKIAAQQAEEKAMLDLYLENGGTIDQFGAIKGIANSEIQELSRNAAIKEFMDDGLTREEAEAEVSRSYYLSAVSELENLDIDNFDSEEDFNKEKARLQKNVDFGAKRLANKAIPIKQQAEQFFNGLKDAIKARESQKQQEVNYSSKVDEHFQKMPREIDFQLGERNGQQINPIKFKVPDSVIEESKSILSDPAKRQQFFFNQDGSLNIENVSKLMVGYNALSHVSKLSFLEGEDRNTKAFESIFPARTAYQVGVNGGNARSDGQGQIAKRGTPQKVGFQQLNKR